MFQKCQKENYAALEFNFLFGISETRGMMMAPQYSRKI
jgi:hypothetical protein